jgi:hypothetical protein
MTLIHRRRRSRILGELLKGLDLILAEENVHQACGARKP